MKLHSALKNVITLWSFIYEGVVLTRYDKEKCALIIAVIEVKPNNNSVKTKRKKIDENMPYTSELMTETFSQIAKRENHFYLLLISEIVPLLS